MIGRWYETILRTKKIQSGEYQETSIVFPSPPTSLDLQFVNCPTTENKALDLLFANVKEAYRGKQVQHELKKRLKMAKVE